MSTDATFGQAAHSLVILGQQELTADHLRLMHDGYLADFAEAVREGALPPREDFRRLLKLSPLRFEFEVDYDLSLEEMIAAGNYDWRNDKLNEKNFPIKGKGKKRFEGKLFAANCSSEDGVKRILAEDRAQPWKPGETEHILAFGAKFPDIQRKTPVVGLGSSAGVVGGRAVPCLYRRDAMRGLRLAWWLIAWPDDWRLLGVREISGSMA